MLNQDYKKIELDKILERLSSLCSNETTKNMALDITPSTDESTVYEELSKTNDAFEMSMAFGLPAFFNFKDVSGSVLRCKNGGKISLKELLDIEKVLNQTKILYDWYSHCENQENSLSYLFSTLTPLNSLQENLERSILPDETIADTASSELLSIRKKIARSGIKLRETLNNMVKSQSVQKCLQDTNITLRDGRYVLPVKAEYRGQIQGLIHDTSSSGQTIFVEPIAVVEANNDIRILEGQEQEEIDRIITNLCLECKESEELIMQNFKICAQLNLYFAKAELGIQMKAFTPVISRDNIIDLKKARHPLLDPKTTVPVDISLGENYRMLLITGPNTGGKTVALKTVGLLTAMAMCGLMIPAAEGSIISVMSNILTDIGDKQSIEASLSTFSSHMVTIADILKKADDRTLVLLDEPGTGTDPVEGAALAESIFEELKYRHSLVMATTHYQELKIYAEKEEAVQNASCEFDNETFKPTYRLKIGTPGKSNAFDIASGLGFPEHIISHARSLISDDNSKFEDVIAKLEKTQAEVEKKERIIEEERAKIVKLREELENEKRLLEESRENELDKARGIASQIIEQTKAESNALIDELESIRKAKEKKDFSQQVSNAKSSSRSTLNRMYDNANPVNARENDENYVLPRKLRQGDNVYVTDIGKSGIIAGKPDDSGQVWVQVGIMKTRVDVSKIRLEEKNQSSPAVPKMRQRKTPSNTNNNSKKAVRSGSMELDIRGYASDEGCYEMETFIDRAIMSGLHTVTIIHGKGTGVLKAAIRQRLRSMKSVKSFRPGVYGEGEDGVTVVELK